MPTADAATVGPGALRTVAVVSGYKAFTGSTSVALSYFDAIRSTGRPTTWNQCRSGGASSEYVLGDRSLRGLALGSFRASAMVNAFTFFPLEGRSIRADRILLTDPILLAMARPDRFHAVIVHDVREFTGQQWNPLSSLGFRRLFRHLRRASLILCDSDATRVSLEAEYPVPAPIRVVHPPSRVVGDPVAQRARSLARLASGAPLHVVYVAVDRPYKNVGAFLELAAARAAPDSGFRFTLVSRLASHHRARARELPSRALTVVPTVPDVSLLYRDADVLVFPSSLEGLGLPLVEAMQSGLPIVAHRASAIPEVVGDGGVLLDDLAVPTWVEALDRLRDPAEFARAASHSAERGRAFTPAAFAARLAPVLDEFF